MALKCQVLTRAAIRALKVGKSLTEYAITATCLKSGDVRYSINIQVDGERIHRVVGRESDGVTREQAERAIETLRTRAREQRLNLPRGRKNPDRFSEVANFYLDRMENSGGKNLKSKRRHLERQLMPFFGEIPACQISAYDVQRFVQHRLQEVGMATVNRELATLSHVFRRAVDWKKLRIDEIPRIQKGVEPRKRITILEDDAITALREAAALESNDDLALFIDFGLNTSMRHSETLRVRFEEIDLTSHRIYVSRAKAGEREQPITPSLAKRLRTKMEKEKVAEGPVFPALRPTAKSPHRTSLAVPFRRAVRRAGLQVGEVTPHVMRHTAITRLVKAGVDLPTIQRISGHRTLSMVLRYAHVHGRHVDAAVALLDTQQARLHTNYTS